jgi:hypothetical protein
MADIPDDDLRHAREIYRMTLSRVRGDHALAEVKARSVLEAAGYDPDTAFKAAQQIRQEFESQSQ